MSGSGDAEAQELRNLVGDLAFAALGESLDIHSIGQLLRYCPRKYVRQGKLSADERPETGEQITVTARVLTAEEKTSKNGKRFLALTVTDGQHRIGVTFFNPKLIRRVLTPGRRVMLAGTVRYFRNQVSLTHPSWMVIPDADIADVDVNVIASSVMKGIAAAAGDDVSSAYGGLDRDLVPVYPATSRIQTWEIWRCIRLALATIDPAADALTEQVREEWGVVGQYDALRMVHFPESEHEVELGQKRLRFDEAVAMQVALAQRRRMDSGQPSPVCVPMEQGIESEFRKRLPFTLTDGQQQVLTEIVTEMGSFERHDPMVRLLQGEVGSGKTLVALLAMLRAIDNNYQCALLAPTEVLAAQHYRTITTMLGELAAAGTLEAAEHSTGIALLTGSLKTGAKRRALLDVVNGSAGIVVGTHALLQENVEFFNLGLVVVDEQHRFGVQQRDALRSKGRDGSVPHLLVMTATPIPRTVAMTLYGDLETSTLTQLPAGRQPITTTAVPMGNPKWVDRVWERVGEEVQAGRQVYVVCSRIGDEAEGPAEADAEGRPQPTAVVDQYERLLAGPLGRHRIGLLHGRLPADEKNAVMDAFSRGEIDILVATTVIEVGVDVPNATTMVIVDADRFGVSQLHQLRGRVGRGGLAGLCLLLSGVRDGSPAAERLRLLEASNDGFELAFADLRARREGDVLGSMQSGLGDSLRYLSLLEDEEILEQARAFADDIVIADPVLAEHPHLAALGDAILGQARAKYLDKA